MNIPVFHDDQHGTAIITAAGLINACHLTGRELEDIKVVVNGAGAAAIACTELIKAMGVRARQRHHVRPQGPALSQGRDDIDQFKSAHAVADRRAQPGRGAGRRRRVPRPVSAAGALKPRHGRWHGAAARSSSPWPIPIPRSLRPRSQGGAPRRDRRHRPLGLSQPGQQRARLPVHLPRRARRARDRDQRGDEDRRRPCAGRAGARGGARGSRRGLWRHESTTSAPTISSRRRSTRG